MKRGTDRRYSRILHAGRRAASTGVSGALAISPMVARAFVRLWASGRRHLGAKLLLLVGLLVQLVLLFVAGYLIDLAISLMELWAELARKHLELTM